MNSFTIAFTVDQTPEQLFAAVADVRAWWSGEIDGPTDRLGAEFTYRYQDLHRSTQRITEFVPGKKIVWQVLDSYLGFVKATNEWNDSRIIFELSGDGNNTTLRFTHVGLVPEHECYNECSTAWTYYINESLQRLITSGRGRPNPAERLSA